MPPNNPIDKAVKEEFRKAGAPPPRKEAQEYEGDDALFKMQVLEPQDPVFYESQKWIDPTKPLDDPARTIETLIKKGHLVSTMALGNFTSREVRGLNDLMSIAGICERYGYYEVAADLHTVYVRRVVASQCIEFKLGTMLLTNLNALYRKEELPPLPEESGTESKNPLAGIFDKIKQLDKDNKPSEKKVMG